MSSVIVNPELLGDETEGGADPELLPDGVFHAGVVIPADRVLLFEVNERQYTGPKQVDKRMVFRYLGAVHRDEGTKALADLMFDALGEPVMDVLATEELSDEEFDAVMKVTEKYVMGATENTLGNSSRGRRR